MYEIMIVKELVLQHVKIHSRCLRNNSGILDFQPPVRR